jgi:hypothetical protein
LGGTVTFHIINASDRDNTSHRFVLHFGAYGRTKCLVWADSLEDALDECVDWIADNKPGLLCDESVQQAYSEAIAEGKPEEAAIKYAERDTTCAGNNGHYIASWEWGILAEDPDRRALKSILEEDERHS